MRITSLLDNVSNRPELACEHGLSLYIEADGKKLLFDMGHTRSFADNAGKLGVDLSAVDFAVVSHGHWDHGGGMAHFLGINKAAPVYLSRWGFDPYYDEKDGRYIGLDAALKDSPRIVLTGDERTLTPHMFLCSCNGRERKDPFGSFGLSSRRGGATLPDDFRHEQYLVIEEGGKRVVVSGCSHKGILNILDWLKPDVLVGGFHFMMMQPGPGLDRYADALEKSGVTFYTGHCTGKEQFEAMRARLSRTHYLSTGETIEI